MSFSCHAAEQAYCAGNCELQAGDTRPTCGFCVSSCSECDVDGVQYHGVTHQDANDMNASVRRRLAQTLPAPGVAFSECVAADGFSCHAAEQAYCAGNCELQAGDTRPTCGFCVSSCSECELDGV